MVTCLARREAARWVGSEFRLSERRACALVGISASSLRYRPREPDRHSQERNRGVGRGGLATGIRTPPVNS
jgi:hypothetical protein